MVFTLGLRHTFLGWSRGLALVQSLVVQASLASFGTGELTRTRKKLSDLQQICDGQLSSGDSCGHRWRRSDRRMISTKIVPREENVLHRNVMVKRL